MKWDSEWVVRRWSATAAISVGAKHASKGRKFIPYNVLGAALWSPAMLLLGYFLGQGWKTAERWIGRASAIIGGVVLFIALLAWLWRWAGRCERANTHD